MKTYDTNLHKVSIGSLPMNTGRVEGEYLTSEYRKEAATLVKGADGEGCVSYLHDKSASVKYKCMQTSDTHKVLMGLYDLQRNTPGGVSFPYENRDISGGLVEHGTVVFEKAPSSPYGATAGEREWALLCDELVREVG